MLALIAGTGTLPSHLARAVPKPPLVARIAGTRLEGLDHDCEFVLEDIAGFLDLLKTQGVSEVCFAGGTRRPEFRAERVTPDSRPYVARLLAAMEKGDGGALSILLGIFEDAGFRIRAAQDIAPDLLATAGPATTNQPGEADRRNAARAEAVLAAMGAADTGQACVIHRGQAIAIEAQFGTDWMLESLVHRPDGEGGLLYKAPKPNQDLRIDLPTIGPGTVERAARAGLSGIVVKAGGVLIIDRDRTIETANAAGLFLWVDE